MSSRKTMYDQREITTGSLENIWQAFVHGWSPAQSTPDDMPRTEPPLPIPAEGEAGRRAIPAMYCYASALTTEASLLDPPYKNAKLAQAEGLLRHCYSLACQTFHRNHLQAIAALVKLQLVLERQGRISEAIDVIQTAIEDGRGTLGTQHPRQLENLRICTDLMKKRWHAEDQEMSVDEKPSVNGITRGSHRPRFAAQKQSRRLLEEKEVEKMLWEVLEGRVKMLGRKHESTMGSKTDLMDWLLERGRGAKDGPDMQHLNDVWSWTCIGAEDRAGSNNGRRGY